MKSAILLIIGIFVAGAIYNSFVTDDKVEGPYIPTSTEAFLMSKELIEKTLKSPKTADFASSGESVIIEKQTDLWEVKSYVDSQNGFGAMLRTHYIITMKVNRDTKYWETVALETEP